MIVIARFTNGGDLCRAAREAHDAGHRPLEAFTPIRVDGLARTLSGGPDYVRVAMAIAGFGIAAMAYALEW